jgi:hypothetical protein
MDAVCYRRFTTAASELTPKVVKMIPRYSHLDTEISLVLSAPWCLKSIPPEGESCVHNNASVCRDWCGCGDRRHRDGGTYHAKNRSIFFRTKDDRGEFGRSRVSCQPGSGLLDQVQVHAPADITRPITASMPNSSSGSTEFASAAPLFVPVAASSHETFLRSNPRSRITRKSDDRFG